MILLTCLFLIGYKETHCHPLWRTLPWPDTTSSNVKAPHIHYLVHIRSQQPIKTLVSDQKFTSSFSAKNLRLFTRPLIHFGREGLEKCRVSNNKSPILQLTIAFNTLICSIPIGEEIGYIFQGDVQKVVKETGWNFANR